MAEKLELKEGPGARMQGWELEERYTHLRRL